jgi:hypothetical protein
MLRSITKRKPVNQIYIGALTHYTAEMIQFVRMCREEVRVPKELLPYVLPRPDLAIFDSRDALAAADGMMIEVCNQDEILFDSIYLNRNLLQSEIVEPTQKLGEPLLSLVNEWFYNGVLKFNDEHRLHAAEKLIAMMPTGTPEADMHREVVRHARGCRQSAQDLKKDIETLREMVCRKAWILSHVLRYMPDGRPLYWPPDLMRQLRKISAEMGLPLLDTAKVVEEKGPEFSLQDERYYKQQFLDEMGERLYDVWIDLEGIRQAG